MGRLYQMSHRRLERKRSWKVFLRLLWIFFFFCLFKKRNPFPVLKGAHDYADFLAQVARDDKRAQVARDAQRANVAPVLAVRNVAPAPEAQAVTVLPVPNVAPAPGAQAAMEGISSTPLNSFLSVCFKNEILVLY